MTDLLTIAEERRLTAHEAVIESGLKHFFAVGKALLAIKRDRLYRGEFANFEDYCAVKWNFTRSRADQLIQAFSIASDETIGCIQPVSNERQARALADVPAEAREQVWQAAVEEAAPKPPTARKIAETAARLKPQPAREYDDIDFGPPGPLTPAKPREPDPFDEMHYDTTTQPVADLAPRENTIGEAKTSITVFINDLIHLKPAYFQMAVADHLDREAARIRA